MRGSDVPCKYIVDTNVYVSAVYEYKIQWKM